MVHVRKSHAVLWAAAAVLLAFLLLGSSVDLWPAVLLAAAAAHFALNVVFSLRTRLRRPGRLDHSIYAGHQDSSPAALEEVFAEEKPGGGFQLPVRLEGEVQGKNAERSPWSRQECVGWALSVEIYRKSALGGDADFAGLAAVNGLGEFRLESGGAAVRVIPPGLVRGGREKEKLLSWKSLDDLPELRRIVDDAMQLQKLNRAKYSGVRAAETLVRSGDTVVVWGSAARERDGLGIRGTSVEGDPGALLVAAPAASGRGTASAAALVRTVLSGLLAVCLLGFAAVYAANASWWKLEQAFPWANLERVGSMHWNGNGKNYELACKTLNLHGDSSWSLGPEDDSVNLVSGDEKAIVRASTAIMVTRPRLPAFTLLPAAPAYPHRLGARFYLTVPETGVTAEQMSVHEGSLYVINHSGGTVEIRFSTARPRPELEKQYWTIVPGDGTTLVLQDKGFPLTEGDGILLRRPGESASRDAFVALGDHPAAAWDKGSTRWVITLDAAALAPRTGELVVANPSSHPVKLDVMDRTGENTRGTWSLPAGFGGSSGEVLESDGKPFLFKEGDTVAVEPHADEVVYRGPLGGYAAASYKDGVWTLRP
jgi:hypothetical protein